MGSKKEVRTFCRICEPNCGLLATVEDEQIVKIMPDKAHPIHKGFACHKGVNFLQVHNDPDRLNYPLKRVNGRSEDIGEFERVTWDDALADIAARIKDIQSRYGEQSVAGYQGNPTSFNTRTSAGFPEFMATLGNSRMFCSATQDCANKFAASGSVYGSIMLHPIPDLTHTDYFLSLGCNPKVSHMSLISISDPMEVLRGITKRGGKIVFVNPKRIESSTPATGEVLQINPDSDLYFLAALIHVIIKRPEFDDTEIQDKARNLAGLYQFVEPYSPEVVESATGIAAGEIRQVAMEFAEADKAAVHMSTGVNMGRQGTLAYWLLQMLSLVTGNLGEKGGNVYAAGLHQGPPATPSGEDLFIPGPGGTVRPVMGILPGNLLVEYILEEQEPVRALIVEAGNPLLSVGGEARLREAFEQLELLVVIDIFRNATGELADYVLPTTEWLERADLNVLMNGIQLQPYVQYTDAVVAPRAERRGEWWIHARLLHELGVASQPDASQDNSLEPIEMVLAESELSIETLRNAECQTVVLPEIQGEWLYSRGVQHSDGKINCCPAEFSEAIDAAADLFEELHDDDRLKLITLRTNYMHNTWLHNAPKLKRGVHETNPLWMHPQDAGSRGVDEGDVISVSNDNGKIEAVVQFDDALKPGVVAMTHGWGNSRTPGLRTAQAYPGVNSNQLLPTGPGSFERLSSQAHMTGIPVEVVKARAS